MRAVPRPPRLHYGWVVAGVTLALLAVAAGARSAPTMLIRPLEGEFGWTTGTISLAIGINIALFGLGGPFGAGLMDRFGVRRLAASALAMLGTAWAMTLLVHAPWQLVLVWGVGVGGASGLLSAVFGAVIANRWFEARRGLVSGIFGAANATGQLIFLPIFGYLVTGPGWRACALAVAAACAAAAAGGAAAA
jgi:MFS family permease